jgi:hypothetical protein
MLNFSINIPNDVYIGVYDCGEAERLQEVTPSLYGFTKEQDASNI